MAPLLRPDGVGVAPAWLKTGDIPQRSDNVAFAISDSSICCLTSTNNSGGYEIRTREGVNPTRFPSERHRPLGESSVGKDTWSGRFASTLVADALVSPSQ